MPDSVPLSASHPELALRALLEAEAKAEVADELIAEVVDTAALCDVSPFELIERNVSERALDPTRPVVRIDDIYEKHKSRWKFISEDFSGTCSEHGPNPASNAPGQTGSAAPAAPATREWVLRVEIHASRKGHMSQLSSHKVQEFEVLESQPLTVLRDRIYCLHDQIRGAGARRHSSFLFVEGVFYNDERGGALSCDYSAVIRRWAQAHRCGVPRAVAADGTFRCASMEKTTFGSLGLRFGTDYLFTHQGDCEHIVIFTGMRALNSQDVASAFPVQTFQAGLHRRKCHACKTSLAKYATFGAAGMCEADPGLLCERCFRALFYDSKGRLAVEADFKVFPHYVLS